MKQMQSFLFALCVLGTGFSATGVLAQQHKMDDMKGMGDMKGMDIKKKPAAAQTHQGTGIVKKVDEAKGTVTLKHDAIKSLKWPGMTMDFAVRDRNMLAKLKPEQKIRFELVEEKGRYVITDVK